MNRIFINIASYRDPELIPTVRDAIEKATNKERLFFGICWQHGQDEPKDFNEEVDPIFEGVSLKYLRIPAEESRGMNWARKLAHGFFVDKCNYYLQIDSHMRFVDGWDYELMKMIANCDSRKPILTQRCFPYYPEKNDKKKYSQGELVATYMHAKSFRDNGVLVVAAGLISTKKRKIHGPFPIAFMSGHFMFAKSKLIKEMPYDESIAIIATGDEPILSMKAWTRGWDMFTPHKPVLYHHFYRKENPKYHMDHKKHHEIPWRDLEGPGVARSNQINFQKDYIGKYGLGKERTIEEFGKYAGVDFKNKKVFSEDRPKSVYFYGDNRDLKEKEIEKKTVKKVEIEAVDPKDKIYVQIASYRDPDVEETINDLLKQAKKPENLIVGVCDQYGPENKHLPIYDKENFRVMRLPFYSSEGLGWARHMIQKMYFDDAEYTMQLDSHMRFVPEWDTKLIKMMKESGSEKPIISHYCPAFSAETLVDDKYFRKQEALLKMYCLRFNKTGTVSFRANHVGKENTTGKPIPSMLVSGHFYFTLGKHIREYKYDPNLYFAGDEISLATRSWTRGWDIFNPSENVVFHNFSREKRVCHWADQKVGYGSLHEESLKRLRQMLHGEENGLDISKYGLGEERSLKDFEKTSGIDFANRTLTEDAREGVFSA